MGDRANAVVLTDYPSDRREGEAVFLYTHWEGESLPETVRQALESPAGRSRADDEPYLARIVFDAMNPEPGGETGLGISTFVGDNTVGRPLLVLYKGHVWAVPESVYKDHGFDALTKSVEGSDDVPRISFAEYIEKPRSWDNLTT